MSPTSSIIIHTLNEVSYLDRLLVGIAQQTYLRSCIEAVMVDSGSNDETSSMVQRHGCRLVTIEQSPFSFGRSLNVGCEAACGSIFVFFSGHCVPIHEDWLWRLVPPLHEDAVGITYDWQEGGRETKFSERWLFEKYFPAHADNGQSPFFCNKANLALKTSCWHEHRVDKMLTSRSSNRAS